jgi:Xaa-Pro aminopeptidase
MTQPVTVLAGVPAESNPLYHRIRFSLCDPAALVTWSDQTSLLIVRDIEVDRAKAQVSVDEVRCPADFPPPDGLCSDRLIATAQSLAICLQSRNVSEVRTDRSLPMIFAHEMEAAGIRVLCDPWLGVMARRSKDEQEIQWLSAAQAATERAVRCACERIAHADTAADGTLMHEGEILTSDRVRAEIDVLLMKEGYANPASIIAAGNHGADCHELGSGPIKTGEPVIIDVFPRDRQTRYHGDCTRTVVHGDPSDALVAMHAAVVDAKMAGIAAAIPGATGQEVHEATIAALHAHGFDYGKPGDQKTRAVMYHGTGHGVGLDVHEPPLLHPGGEELVPGDVITIEPGLYQDGVGGVRVEDMVVVRPDTPLNLNKLPEGLCWA